MSATTETAAESLLPAPDSGAGRRWLASRLQPHRRWLGWARIGALLGLVGVGLLYAGLAGLLSAALTTTPGAPSDVVWLAMATGLLLRLVGGLLRDRAGLQLSAKVRQTLRGELLATATRHGPARLASLGPTAWWTQRLLDQVDALHGYHARYLPALEAAKLLPLAVAGLVLALDWIAGLLLLIALPLIPLFMALIGLGTQAVQEAQQDRQARLAAELQQRLLALPALRRLGALPESIRAVAEAADGHRTLAMRVLRVAFLSSSTLELFSALAIGLVALYVGFALLGLIGFGPAPQLTPATGFFILMLAPEAFLPLRQLAQAYHDRGAALAAAESLAPLLGAIDPGATPQVSNEPTVALRFEAVDFGYGEAPCGVLAQQRFALQRGEVLGLSGSSGSGKSTVLALAAGFLAPRAGRIVRCARWAWVPQRVHLFHGTLRANLQLAARVDDEALHQALAAVGLALPQPALPAGLDTSIGDGDSGVSGGQAQRIGVARALLAGAGLWLLDEPTAALDESARDQLLDRLLPLAREAGAAVLIASHDPVVLARCDRVLALPAGDSPA